MAGRKVVQLTGIVCPVVQPGLSLFPFFNFYDIGISGGSDASSAGCRVGGDAVVIGLECTFGRLNFLLQEIAAPVVDLYGRGYLVFHSHQ